MKPIAFFLLFFMCLSVAGAAETRELLFAQRNNLYIPVGTKSENGISQEQFNKVIDKIETAYSPVIRQMRGTLQIERRWEDGTVNAGASRSGKIWLVKMYGGLARHIAITEDGFSLALCHEIGHHIGGAPKIKSAFSAENWGSNDGQADYWSTLKCLRTIFLNDDNETVVKSMNVPAVLLSSCKKAHPNKKESAVCIRSGMAAASVSNLFADISEEEVAQFNTPDSRLVSITADSHPSTQCRLDTFFQGSLCEKIENEEVSQTDEVQGTCHGSTGQTMGLRPRCWFKPSK